VRHRAILAHKGTLVMKVPVAVTFAPQENGHLRDLVVAEIVRVDSIRKTVEVVCAGAVQKDGPILTKENQCVCSVHLDPFNPVVANQLVQPVRLENMPR